MVTSSSAGIFEELKNIPIRVDHPVEPDSTYGCTKLCEEKLSLVYSKLYPLEVVCLRYFNVYGPSQSYDAYGNPIPIFVFRILKGETIYVYGHGEQTRDFVHVSDVVRANILAASADGVSGAFNIASGRRITVNRLVKLIMSYGDGRPVVEHTGRRAVDVLHSLADISKARLELGYTSEMGMEEGLRSYIAWAGSELQDNSHQG